jgi:transposase-like protein
MPSDNLTSLDNRWACLTCNSTFRLGDGFLPVVHGGSIVCPKCKNDNTFPANKEVRSLDGEYDGEIGTLN